MTWCSRKWGWEVRRKNGGRWEVDLNNTWEVRLVGGGRGALKNGGMWDISPPSRWEMRG